MTIASLKPVHVCLASPHSDSRAHMDWTFVSAASPPVQLTGEHRPEHYLAWFLFPWSISERGSKASGKTVKVKHKRKMISKMKQTFVNSTYRRVCMFSRADRVERKWPGKELRSRDPISMKPEFRLFLNFCFQHSTTAYLGRVGHLLDQICLSARHRLKSPCTFHPVSHLGRCCRSPPKLT